jgi:hypothetical protein
VTMTSPQTERDGGHKGDGHRDDDGYVLTFFVVAFALTLLVVTALTVDGGRILAGRRAASTMAFTAARVGAQSYAVNEQGVVAIDPALAAASADAYLNDQGFGDHSVGISGDVITVTVHNRVTTVLLHLVGIGSKTVTAVGNARPASGITKEGG